MRRDFIDGEVLRPLPRAVRRSKLARLLMAGASPSRAAELLGVSPEAVRRECRDPEFRRAVLDRVDRAFAGVDDAAQRDALTLTDQIKLSGQEAFDTLLDLMRQEATNPAVRARIAQDLLDRNPETGRTETVRHELIQPQDLAAAAQVAREMDAGPAPRPILLKGSGNGD